MSMTRRLAAILAADVVGFSRLMETDEAGTLAALKSRRKEVLEPLVAKHQGRVFKITGDGVLVEFASAVNAVQCATELQQGFAEANKDFPEDRCIVLRIGVNLGDVMVEGGDLYGDGVNIAARLEALAEPGGILVSGKLRDEVGRRLELVFDDLGERTLKNIEVPVRVFRARTGRESVPARPALSLPTKPSIAVLPFQNMSGDPEQEYFADGMVEEIITALSRMKWLFVIARNSSFIYKGRAVDVKQVGRELGVRYVLEGSVRKSGNRVRITGQLIDAASGAHLWADRFEGALADVFDLQDQVTASVVGAIAPKLEEAEIERSRRKPTENLDAYDYYLRGLAAVHQWTREANIEALVHFTRAIELDPKFAAAFGMAARSYSQRKLSGWLEDPAAAIPETARLAWRAAELGKDDAVALCTAGISLGHVVGDVAGAAGLIDRAVVLNPNLAWAWYFSGWVKAWLGEPDVAIEHLARAMRLSPQDPYMFNMQTGTAYAHFFAGRFEEALTWAEIALREKPTFAPALCTAAVSAALAGRQAQAESAVARLLQASPAASVSTLKGWFPVRRPEHVAMWEEGLRRAGLSE